MDPYLAKLISRTPPAPSPSPPRLGDEAPRRSGLTREAGPASGVLKYKSGDRTFFLITKALTTDERKLLAFSQEVLRTYQAVRDNQPIPLLAQAGGQ